MQRRGSATATNECSSLSDLLFYLPTPELRAELEEFRLKYEAKHGPTDMTKSYTSRWPAEQQAWMLNHDKHTREAWLRGVPDFAREFCRLRVNAAATSGALSGDATTIQWIRDFIGGHACPPATPRGDRTR